LLPELDNVIAALIQDLRNNAIFVVASEFGRDPRKNAQDGREHWPRSNFMLISGPGISTGVAGRIDNNGQIIQDKYKAELMGPTILKAAGYELVEVRNGMLTTEKMPYYPIFNS